MSHLVPKFQHIQNELQWHVGNDCAWLVQQYLQPEQGVTTQLYLQYHCVLAELSLKFAVPSKLYRLNYSCCFCTNFRYGPYCVGGICRECEREMLASCPFKLI
jgi:hypothetical protein